MKKNISKLLLIIFMFMVFPYYVNAESTVATFSLNKNVESAKQKGTFQVSVNLKNNDTNNKNSLNGYSLKISYDKNLLQYIDDASNPGVINLAEDVGNDTIGTKTVATLNFRVLDNASAGNTNIGIEGTCKIDGETDKDKKCEFNSTSLKIESLGTDARLSSLKIPNAILSPAFSSDVTTYSASIKDITELTVNATAKDSNAKIEITDNYKNLQKGENKILVVVTSEDGNSSKTYTINVNLTLTPTDEELLKQDATLKDLVVKGQELTFESTEKKYYLTVDYDINKLDVVATPKNEKATVKIDGNNKLIVGKNTIKITVTSEDETKKEDYQILVTRNEQKKKVVQTCPEVTSTFEWIIFSIGLLVTFTLGIILGYILCKKDVLSKLFKKKKTEEEPVEVETFSDTINISDTIDAVKKNINK